MSRFTPLFVALLLVTRGRLEKIENILVRKTYSGEFFEGDELTVGDVTLGVTTFHMVAAFGKMW